MEQLRKRLTKTLAKASGFNWYKWGAIFCLLIAWSTFVHTRATSNCQLEHERQKTAQVEKKAKEQVDHVNERLPVIQQKDKEFARLRNELARTKEELDEAIRSSGSNPSCDLTDAEYRGFYELSEKTRSPK